MMKRPSLSTEVVHTEEEIYGRGRRRPIQPMKSEKGKYSEYLSLALLSKTLALHQEAGV